MNERTPHNDASREESDSFLDEVRRLKREAAEETPTLESLRQRLREIEATRAITPSRTVENGEVRNGDETSAA